MAMASTAYLSLYLGTQLQSQRNLYHIPRLRTHQNRIFTSKSRDPFVIFPKNTSFNLILPLSTSQSSSPPTLQNPPQTGRFLTNDELEKLQFLEDFRYFQELKSGFLYIRMMEQEEIDMTVSLLAESFAESMFLPKGYVRFLEYLVKQYMIEKRTLMPHTATLLGFYKEDEEEDLQLAGTVEVSFNKKGANASPPTPTPPKNSPYICNMTVKESLRRRGIGWHLLKATEELIAQMTSSRYIYLHCRMIDEAPLNMYKKAGYSIVKTDSILIFLTLQRRKHLMCKQIPVSTIPSEMDTYKNLIMHTWLLYFSFCLLYLKSQIHLLQQMLTMSWSSFTHSVIEGRSVLSLRTQRDARLANMAMDSIVYEFLLISGSIILRNLFLSFNICLTCSIQEAAITILWSTALRPVKSSSRTTPNA